MKSLGITGNIGSGKSYVLDFLSKKFIKTYDLDKIAKNIYKEDELVKQEILQIFPDVTSKEKEIDTKILGKLVFNDDEMLHSLKKIIWPRIETFIQDKKNSNQNEFIAFEGAVIIDARWHKMFDYIWIIDTNIEISKKRVLNSRDISEIDFMNIINNQMKLKEMQILLENENCKYSIIENNSNIDELNTKVEKELNQIRL
ncbi:MAG: dephospho-CoA kinase [SAR202 cluster bacterium]|nr:MAG: dephospho-CoA kinase [SAR202 cluster bacterium]KAA1298679.1 MAG: dephospho-CoA kinase [SAR202 cluster bacterium]|tara:strand:+ start:4424 stop:5023 length:600 start_codon:yes stop_codon:yes gene_type:complete